MNDPFEFTGADLSNLEFREAMGGLKDYLNEKWGLLCFSKSWDNPVQWTHYTDKHKGLCLGFDVPHPDWLLAEVNYEDERLSVDRFLAGINMLRDKVCAEKDDYTDQSASIEEARVKAQEFRKIVESEGFPVDPETDKEDREFISCPQNFLIGVTKRNIEYFGLCRKLKDIVTCIILTSRMS